MTSKQAREEDGGGAGRKRKEREPHTRSLGRPCAARRVMVCLLSLVHSLPLFLTLLCSLPAALFALGPNSHQHVVHSSVSQHEAGRQRRFSTVASLSPSFDFHPLLSGLPAQNASGVRVRLFPRGVEALNLVREGDRRGSYRWP